VLDHVGELLTVVGGAARVGIDDNVALGCHVLELVIEDPAVSRVRSAMDVENHRVLLGGIEIRWLLHPGLDGLACDVLGIGRGHNLKVVRHGEFELREESLVDVRELGLRIRAVERKGEEVADVDRRGDEEKGLGRGGRDGEGQGRLLFCGELGDLTGGGIECDQDGAAAFADEVVQNLAVGRPAGSGAAGSAGSGVVATDAATNLIVILRCKVVRWFGCRSRVARIDLEQEHVRLLVRARLGRSVLAVKGNAIARGRDGEAARGKRELGNKGDGGRSLAGGRRQLKSIDLVVGEIVVRLIRVLGGEVQNRSAGFEERILDAETAEGELDGSSRGFAGFGEREQVELRDLRSIGVPFAIRTVDGTRDDTDIGLMLVRLFAGVGPLVLLGLRKNGRRGREDETGAGGSPLRVRDALFELRKLRWLASREWKQEELRGLGFAVFFQSAGEGERGAVGRPARLAVVGAVGETAWRGNGLSEVEQEERRIVAVMFCVDGGLDEDRAGAVGGELRVADPGKREEILVGDVAFLSGDAEDGEERQRSCDKKPGAHANLQGAWF